MTFKVVAIYWAVAGFTVEVLGTSDDGVNTDSFTLVFATTALARDTFNETLATAANARWGSSLLGSQVVGTALIPNMPPTDTEGRPLVSLSPDTAVGLPSVMVIDIPDAAVVKLKSWQVTTPAQTTLIKDVFIGDDFIGPQGRCFLAGGEYRVRATNGHGAKEGSALHLAIVDRDNLLGYFGYYGLNRTKLTGLTDITGAIVAGDSVTGATSGSLAEVLSVDSDSCDVTYHNGPFTDGEALTFSGGATATLGVWDEGDVIEIVRNVKDEWIEDFDHRDYSPGGSREIPTGLYLRIICYNAHATDDLRVKVSFTFGAMLCPSLRLRRPNRSLLVASPHES